MSREPKAQGAYELPFLHVHVIHPALERAQGKRQHFAMEPPLPFWMLVCGWRTVEEGRALKIHTRLCCLVQLGPPNAYA